MIDYLLFSLGFVCEKQMVDNSKPREYTGNYKVDWSKPMRKRADSYGYE